MIAVTGCGSDVPKWWESPPTGTPTAPSPVPVSTITVVNVTLDLPGLNGGGTTTGTVRANTDAPASGAEIRLTANNPVVQVPATVTIPGGARIASFTIATQPVPQDAAVDVVATFGSVSGRASLAVWAVLPNSFWWISDPADTLWRGRWGRHTPAGGTVFTARCEGNRLVADIRPAGTNPSSSVWMTAPRGIPLRPGTYEGAMRFNDAGGPELSVGIDQTGCNTSHGRFVVTEADFAPTGQVNRFVATFEQYCTNSATPVRGEIRLTGPFTMPPFSVTCQR